MSPLPTSTTPTIQWHHTIDSLNVTPDLTIVYGLDLVAALAAPEVARDKGWWYFVPIGARVSGELDLIATIMRAISRGRVTSTSTFSDRVSGGVWFYVEVPREVRARGETATAIWALADLQRRERECHLRYDAQLNGRGELGR